MKTVTTREVQHHFARVLEYLSNGEEIEVTRRNKVIARLSPPRTYSHATPVKQPDYQARMNDIFGGRTIQGNAVLEDRASSDL